MPIPAKPKMLATLTPSISPESDFKKPEDWAKDILSQHLDVAHTNAYYTMNALRSDTKRVRRVLETFRYATEAYNSYRKRKPVVASDEYKYDCAIPFVVASEASFAAAANLVMSQQLIDSFKLIRGCLETAFYGWYVNQNPEKWELWCSRPLASDIRTERNPPGTKRKLRRKVGAEFSVSYIASRFPTSESRLREYALHLYEETIDLGAHYNLPALQTVGSLKIEPTHTTVSLNVIGATQDEVRTTLRKLAEVGICSLRIFDLSFATIWNPRNVSAKIARLTTDFRK